MVLIGPHIAFSISKEHYILVAVIDLGIFLEPHVGHVESDMRSGSASELVPESVLGHVLREFEDFAEEILCLLIVYSELAVSTFGYILDGVVGTSGEQYHTDLKCDLRIVFNDALEELSCRLYEL